jgi:hypothetical protein
VCFVRFSVLARRAVTFTVVGIRAKKRDKSKQKPSKLPSLVYAVLKLHQLSRQEGIYM